MYRVEDEWFTKEEADAYHADVANPWQYIGEHFVCRSTLPVEWTSWARWHADQTYDDLVRIYGVEPEEKPIFGVLNSLAQYNNFAAGDQAAQRQPTESTGFSSLHYAHIADIWFDIVNAGSDNPSAEYVGGGIAFWDVNDPAMKDWGPYAVRHAAALSYAENIDRAWEIVSQFLGGGGGGGAPASIWDGKKLPPWLVYGAACYVERYYEDKENTEDPWGKRRWAIAQVTKDGEPHSLESIFQLPLDINDIAGSTRYILESGLLVSFIMDGGCEPVRAKHEAFRTAFLAGEDPKPALAELQQAVLDNEDAFRAFAGLGPKPAAEPASETVEASAGH
jgi:hypothetical protein